MTVFDDRAGILRSTPDTYRRVVPRRTIAMTSQAQPNYLLHQVAAGESRAVERLIDQYGALVWSLARRYFGKSAEAEDAVQDTFIALWKAAERYDPQTAAESTFIAMIARRRMIDRLRKTGRRVETQPLDASPDPMVGKNESKDALEHEEQAEIVLNAIDALDPPQPEIIRRSILDGLTHSEIAEAMQIPLGTVKTHIRRGLIKVRQALGIETTAKPAAGGTK